MTLPAARDIQAYRGLELVAGVQPNYLARIAMASNDPCFARTSVCDGQNGQWNLYGINAALAWDVVPGVWYDAAAKLALPKIKVAVIDTKIDFTHPDWANPGGTADALTGGQLSISEAASWVPPGAEVGPAAYHGTYVAGLLAAATNNSSDIASLGYRAEIIPLSVVQGSGFSDAASVAEAVAYGHQHGARVINLSLGLVADADAVHQAIQVATTGPSPALVVAAAGNNTGDDPFYPGSYPEVMSVGGVGHTFLHAGCANFNDNVSVAAPAEFVVSLAPMPDRYTGATLCGTSAAAPQVSALATLLFAQDPFRTPAQVRAIIERTADDFGAPGKDPYFGWGLINADKAVREGVGPVVGNVAATVAAAKDSSSTITATATSTTPITAAEGYVDRPGDPAMRFTLQPVSGQWGTTVSLSGVMPIPTTFPPGKRRVFVRAFDGAWGAAYTGWLLVDRKPPVISNFAASNVYRPIIEQYWSHISFQISDEYSSLFDADVEVMTAVDRAVIWSTSSPGIGPGYQNVTWEPEPSTLPGRYEILVRVKDSAGNVATKSLSILVI